MNIFIDPILFIQFLRQSIGGIFDSFFISCSFYGETVSVIVLMALFYWCIDKKLGEYLFISFCGINFITSFLKNALCIYRPWILDSRVKPVTEALATATGYSFPSGHASNAVNLFGGLILRGKYSKTLNIIFAVCMILILFSRNYLGVHSILDVLGALLYTVIVLIIFSKIFDKLEENPNLDIIISAIGLILMILVSVFTFAKGYPMDYDSAGKLIVDPVIMNLGTYYIMGLVAGILISWPIERRFIKFSAEGTTENKIIRFLGGFIGIGFIVKVILPIIGSNTALENFTGMFILGLFIMLIYPAIIKYFQNHKIEKN
ncbi:phosphatase PAP2 family protein [uncultured Methanobrevibacter sp.]|uniref:phosphatase PAP2 family protein n=1 Tax=uncultured Methanobrevibacter sp. TaxID=253161 RepID=UPI0025F97ADB|nr:phosphatase PAP2 family protein [uncultured Methanobrevibacter sp.]